MKFFPSIAGVMAAKLVAAKFKLLLLMIALVFYHSILRPLSQLPFLIESASSISAYGPLKKGTHTTPKSYPFIFQDLNQADQCNWPRNDTNILRCLIPSPNGNTASFKTYSRNDRSVRGLRKASIFKGRFHNALSGLTNYIHTATICNWLIEIPSNSIPMKPNKAWQGFNCVDLRDTLREDGVGSRCAKFQGRPYDWFHNRDAVDTALSKDQILPRIMLSRRIKNAYMGMNKGRFACQKCSNGLKNQTQQIIAYLRGEDIFTHKKPHRGYGQPPLDYYMKSIQHAANRWEGDSEVILVSIDRRNPVVNALELYFSNSSTTPRDESDANITVIAEIGKPFASVLMRLYCAETIILGQSSMNMLIALGNAQNIYYPRPMAKFHPGANVSRTTDNRTGYIYEMHGKYSVVDAWTNSPKQREEMLSFHNASLVAGHIKIC